MRKLGQWWRRAVVAAGSAWAWAGVASDRLPTITRPEGVTDDGDYVGLLRGFAGQFAVLAGLVISTIAFLVVAKNVITKYSAVSDNRATWGEVGLHAGAGVVLLVVVLYLMGQALPILTGSS